jgi:hypothetical protein
MTGSVRDPAYQFLRLSFGRLEIDDLREVNMCGGIKVKIAVRCEAITAAALRSYKKLPEFFTACSAV